MFRPDIEEVYVSSGPTGHQIIVLDTDGDLWGFVGEDLESAEWKRLPPLPEKR